jgi:SLOG cluster2
MTRRGDTFHDDDASLPLLGVRICISGSVPETQYWQEPATDRSILEFVRLLSGHVLKLGGHIVHGSHPSFTPAIARQAERFQAEHPEERPLTLVVSKLWLPGKLEMEFISKYQDVAKIVVTPTVGGDNPNDAQARNLSLTALRLALVEESDVVVAVGGRLNTESGFSPGVLQELVVARWRHLPCFVIAGLGGMTRELDTQIIAQLCEENRLDANVRQKLADSRDIVGTVGTIVEHLVHSREVFALPHTRVALFGRFNAASATRDLVVDQSHSRLSEIVRASADRFKELLDAVNESNLGRFTELLNAPG